MVVLSQQTIYAALTPREYETLYLLNEGLSDREIAARLVVTVSTVKWYNHQIYEKLAVSNRMQAILRANELGLLQRDAQTGAPQVALPRHNLRAEPTQFIGRKRELDEVKQLLHATRLLTLTGSPGTGKTRLSLRAGLEVLPDFSDGVYFVSLAPIGDPALLPLAIADALGLKERVGESIVETLIHPLRAQQLLLILDNYEHLLPEITLVADLLSISSKLKILVTSREPLRLYGEHEYSVPPLELPAVQDNDLDTIAQREAVALFLQQARAVKSDFALTDENARDIAQICIRLDGLPLAIELAAAHTKLLSPAGLLKRLAKPLDMLVGGARNVAVHQRTLRETIDWSYTLLSDDEKKLFACLSLFVGGWTLEAVEAVCSEGLPLDPFEGLRSLIDKSLIRPYEIDGEPRFMLLETIREYARERLQASGDRETLRQRHAEYYIDLAERLEQMIIGVNQRSALDQLEREHDNFRAALVWSKSVNPELGLRFIATLGTCWQIRGHILEGLRWSQSLLESSQQLPSIVRTKALRSACLLAYHLGDFERCQQMAREALVLARQTNDPITIALAIHDVGMGLVQPHMTPDDCREAQAAVDEALTIFRTHNHVLGIAKCLLCSGEIARLQENFELAQALNKEAVSHFSQLGNTSGMAIAATNLGWITLRLGEHKSAEKYFCEGLTLAQQIDDKSAMLAVVAGLAGLAAMSRQPDRAIRLFGAIETQQRMYGNSVFAADLADYNICIAAAHEQHDERKFTLLWEEGRNLALEAAIVYALGDSGLTTG